MTLRAAAQLKIDFGVPCYNYLHLTDFEGRLSLQKAKINMHSSTAFADTKVESFVDANSNVWVLDCEAEYREILPGGAKAEVSLERWGSRPFRSWSVGDALPLEHPILILGSCSAERYQINASLYRYLFSPDAGCRKVCPVKRCQRCYSVD